MAGSGFKKRSAVADRTVLTPNLRLSLYELNVRTESTLDHEDASHQLECGRVQVITVYRLTLQRLILVAVILSVFPFVTVWPDVASD